MKSTLLYHIPLVMSTALGLTLGEPTAARNGLPGVRVFSYSPALKGELVMLIAAPETLAKTNAPGPPWIYSFDLSRKTMREVTRVPRFNPLAVSPDGRVFCVMDGPFVTDHVNAFLYSEERHLSRNISLSGAIMHYLLMGDSAFFVTQTTNGSRLVQYRIADNKLSVVRVPAVEVWEHENYEDLWSSPGSANILHFTYKGYRRPLREPRNYVKANYCYNLLTGELRAARQTASTGADVDINGRYVFFEGSGGPIEGKRLVSSPVAYPDLKYAAPATRKDVKLLHRFPRAGSVESRLLQLSPCKRYALVQSSELVGSQPGVYVHTYYAVDVSSGRIEPLLKDEVELRTGGRMWQQVYWIAEAGSDR